MTIYRSWPDMPQLLGDLMTREWAAVVRRASLTRTPTVDRGHPHLATISALRDNELFQRIVELDPELLLPYLLHRRGRSQDLMLGLIEGAIPSARPSRQHPRRQPGR